MAAADVGIDVSATIEQCGAVVGKLSALVDKTGNSNLEDSSQLSPLGLSAADTAAAGEVIGRNVIRGHSFCVTRDGRVCNAMHAIAEGDSLVALAGYDKLFVLRPVGDKYRLIGDAYVHGLMYGEAYDGLDPDEVDYDIELI
jgi:hypothetical protein